MTQNYDVCIVDDDPNDAKLIRRILENAGYSCVIASDGESGWELIRKHHPKVVVCDWIMPGINGLDLAQKMRADPILASTYFLMVTGVTDEISHAKALTSSVDDVISKPVDHSLLLARVRVGQRLWDTTEQLRKAAITDGLTGLYNHDYLTTIIDREFNRVRRYGGQLALIMLDLDFFKAVNDTYGHLTGNKTLIEVARILGQSVRDIDTVGRFGGEEFAIVAPETPLSDATTVSQRIRLAIADTICLPELHGHQITASLGVATMDDVTVRSAADLIDRADRALYAAKREGRNRVVSSAEMSSTESFVGLESQEVEALRKRVAVMSVQAKEIYMQSVASLVQALEEKDPFTARHAINVAFYCEKLASVMGCNEALTQSVRNAGLLHDVGKVGIPDRILMKPAGLSEVEAVVIQQVPEISVRILDHLRILDSEIMFIRHQREFYDGSGYPSGLVGDQIPIGSRILLVANAFDAMTTDRVYRACRSIDDALAELKLASGKQFDSRVVDALFGYIRTNRAEVTQCIRATADAIRTPSSVY